MVIGCISCKNNQVKESNETIEMSTSNSMVATKNKLETTIKAYLNLKGEKEIDSLVTEDFLRNMNGIPVVTNKKVKINGFSHLYFNEEGRIYREDIFYNELEFLQQMGYSLKAPILK